MSILLISNRTVLSNNRDASPIKLDAADTVDHTSYNYVVVEVPLGLLSEPAVQKSLTVLDQMLDARSKINKPTVACLSRRSDLEGIDGFKSRGVIFIPEENVSPQMIGTKKIVSFAGISTAFAAAKRQMPKRKPGPKKKTTAENQSRPKLTKIEAAAIARTFRQPPVTYMVRFGDECIEVRPQIAFFLDALFKASDPVRADIVYFEIAHQLGGKAERIAEEAAILPILRRMGSLAYDVRTALGTNRDFLRSIRDPDIYSYQWVGPPVQIAKKMPTSEPMPDPIARGRLTATLASDALDSLAAE